MSNVHREREALGGRLRELRRAAGLTGRELAEALGWPPSKVSKLETGKQTPTEQDFMGWVEATGASGEDRDSLLAALRTLESRHAEWQRVLRGGMRHHQSEWGEHEQRAGLLRVFEPCYIPGLVQTPGYARARVAEAISMHGLANDIDEAVRARMLRQEALYDSRKRFHLVVSEAALRYRLCSPEVMLGQLDRLVTASTLPNVRLGVIGFDTAYVTAPKHGFWLFDSERVLVETFTAELNLAQPHEIEAYSRIFRSLAGMASYGSDMRAIVTRVMEDLRAGLPDGETSDEE
ncbi:helix-turn-helix transcriptional regulator [Acrocarpospora macrocephala]|uniref:Transcriptional regulator n=1 Tax=Acrocarpospora macrocephala TaxID=150177 RepID=A0A5M3WTI4_9ACTN|nr:helix-turn-helix transcriptional regulator [Acrocarpospora macrocephala]GES11349.1 transcriptional regulator [Acrocarpospora macrocephala]